MAPIRVGSHSEWLPFGIAPVWFVHGRAGHRFDFIPRKIFGCRVLVPFGIAPVRNSSHSEWLPFKSLPFGISPLGNFSHSKYLPFTISPIRNISHSKSLPFEISLGCALRAPARQSRRGIGRPEYVVSFPGSSRAKRVAHLVLVCFFPHHLC